MQTQVRHETAAHPTIKALKKPWKNIIHRILFFHPRIKPSKRARSAQEIQGPNDLEKQKAKIR